MNPSLTLSSRYLTREEFLRLLGHAFDSRSYRFARQAALAWLAIYPGDLAVNFQHAAALAKDGKPAQALPILDRIMRMDPERGESYRLMADITQGVDVERHSRAKTMLVALGVDELMPGTSTAAKLRDARQATRQGQFEDADTLLRGILGEDLLSPLLEVSHLKAVKETHDAEFIRRLAEMYRVRFPDCIAVNLTLASAMMEVGEESGAVRILHQCAAADPAGEVATFLWGNEHPYRALWPEAMGIHFDLPVPAEVAFRLGWNQLPEGSPIEAVPSSQDFEVVPEQAATVEAIQDPEAAELPTVEEIPAVVEVASEPIDPPTALEAVDPEPTQEAAPVEPAAETEPATLAPAKAPGQDADVLKGVEAELKKLAKKINQPVMARTDGRFPVYVILSMKTGLEAQYGPNTSAVIDTEIKRLAGAIKKRTGWESLVYYADDAQCTETLGIQPAGKDPWKLKLALADLDKALAKRGEMIAMLLIVGGPDVVPFHELPNPTDDYDTKVLSDNPYSTLDSNYFIPEWPVGRLPGECGPDACLLIEELRFLIGYHQGGVKAKGLGASSVLSGILEAVKRILAVFGMKKTVPNTGYSASVWKRSSMAVFRPIGSPHQMMVCPPQKADTVPSERILSSELGYYNLHGVEEGGEWYGQKDPAENVSGPDYPVALTPKELRKNGHAPRIVFSEACYGGNITNKSEENALALKFLALGTLGVAASTCIAYGSVTPPLVAADLLGNYFWQHLRNGRPAGEALMAAKIEMAREMIRRQGFLDAEDQKTLISFVLYGDPLVSMEGRSKRVKSALRLKRQPRMKVAEEKPVTDVAHQPVPSEVIRQVKESMADYLPGLDSAEVTVHELEVVGGAAVPSGQKSTAAGQEGAYVVTMSKQIRSARNLHRHYIRATVNRQGKVVKLAVSR